MKNINTRKFYTRIYSKSILGILPYSIGVGEILGLGVLNKLF